MASEIQENMNLEKRCFMNQIIIEDLGQKYNEKVDKHRLKHGYWDKKGIKWKRRNF